MKKIFTLSLALFSLGSMLAQSPADYTTRSVIDPALAPFYHGVASGDPLSDRVIIWTRITLNPPISPVTVNWQMATDTLFNNVVQSGTTSTDLGKDFTVKVDVTGLQPNSWYYYRFQYDNLKSIIGRTRTLPLGDVDSLRFAVASCQDYQNGFYNAHKHLSRTNDVDAIFFLGDYIYEYAASSSVGRDHEPTNEIITLSDYRTRHSQYKLDPDMRAVHQQYPFIAVWDDHETANDAYTDGAQNHDEATEGPFTQRKTYSTQAYSEWMPIRLPEPNNTFKIYRKFKWGNLSDVYFMDTRLFDRSVQVGYLTNVNNAVVQDTSRHMLGWEQFGWFKNQVSASTSQWQIMAQQIMMAPLMFNILGNAFVINGDQWDAYPFERQRIFDFIMNNNIQNFVVLTGDIHSSWANDLPYAGYNASTGSNSVGVEFVGTSITSSNALNLPGAFSLIQSINPHIKYADLEAHGYYILDVNKTRTQGDWYYVSDVNTQTATTSCAQAYYVNAGERHLRVGTCVTQVKKYPPLAPTSAPNSGLASEAENLLVFNAYPNPFLDKVVVQYYLNQNEEIVLSVTDQNGKKVYSSHLGKCVQGLNYAHFDGSQLAKGTYVITLQGRKNYVGKTLLKVE